MKPEDLLVDYRSKIVDLYSSLSFLNEEKDEISEINKLLEKLLVQTTLMTIVQEKHVIAISGSQGAGKSTLMKWFLGIHGDPEAEQWFPENLDVGENLPVLITLSNEIKQINGRLYSMGKDDLGNTSISESEISAEESKAKSHIPSNKDIYIEIICPYPTFADNRPWFGNTSFLLLPGVEILNPNAGEGKIFSQEHMKSALTACSNTIFVLDPNNYATKKTQDTLDEVSKMFNGVNYLIALTNSDLAKDENSDLKRTISETRSIPLERIVCTGSLKRLADEWRATLRDMILEYGQQQVGLHNSQIDAFKKIKKNVDKVLKKVKAEINKDEISDLVTYEKVNRYLRSFDGSFERINRLYKNACISKYNSIAGRAFLNLDKDLKDKPTLDKIGEWFSEKLTGTPPIVEVIELGERHYKDELKRHGKPNDLRLAIFNEVMNELVIFQNLPTDTENINGEILRNNSLIKPNGNDLTWDLDGQQLQTLQYLIGNPELRRENWNPESLTQVMGLIPYILLESCRLRLAANKSFLDFEHLIKYHIDQNPGIEIEIRDWIDTFSENAKGVTLGAIAILGADFMPDGRIDSLTGVWNMMTGAAPTGAPVAAGAPAYAGLTAVGWAVAGVAVTAIAYSVNQAAIQAQLIKIRDARAVIESIKDQVIQKMIHLFEIHFTKVRDEIIQRISDSVGIGVNEGRLLKLEQSIHQLNEANIELQRLIRANA